jgi:hypothetical protein
MPEFKHYHKALASIKKSNILITDTYCETDENFLKRRNTSAHVTDNCEEFRVFIFLLCIMYYLTHIRLNCAIYYDIMI